MTDLQLTLVDDPVAGRFEARTADGAVAGYSEYRRSPTRIVFTHTVTEPQYEGRGVASRLVRFALDDSRERGLRVTPVCPFVRSYIRRHDEYADLAAAGPPENA
jgi:uncharacterized protein